jgi:hypothetical protein
VTRYLILAAAALLLVIAVLPSPASAVSPEQAASDCYDQAKKMGFSSRDMEDRSWEDCMAQFRRSTTVPAPPATVAPAPRSPWSNIGLEAGRGALRAACNSEGGYYTPDGQCLRPTPQLPARLPSWQCQQIGNMTNCTPF